MRICKIEYLTNNNIFMLIAISLVIVLTILGAHSVITGGAPPLFTDAKLAECNRTHEAGCVVLAIPRSTECDGAGRSMVTVTYTMAMQY